ncbi:MAG: stage II sporulation protein P [Alicyclobacillaceae bacterium]|nr:stage II sporulation protein P [Alicyclobacillaceae bacterium]
MRKQPPFRVIALRVTGQLPRLGAAALLSLSLAAVTVMALAWPGRPPSDPVGRLASRVGTDTWSTVLYEGMPAMTPSVDRRPPPARSWGAAVFSLLTEVDPAHPSTLLSRALPGMAETDYPIAVDGGVVDLRPPDDGSPSPRLFSGEQPSASPKSGSVPAPAGDPAVYIYHTHNRESYLPMLPGRTNFDDAYDQTKNITLVGARIVEELKKRGIPAVHTTVDYYPMGDYSKEYTFSRKTVEEVLKRYPRLQIILDVHRDSDPRGLTTVEIGGQTYAKIRFIIGGNNPNHDANQKLAEALKSRLDQAYPHLVRDIWAKKSTVYDATYNQDLSPNMVLVEIGGPENTEEEVYRTAACLADGIAALLSERARSGE